MAKNVFAYFDTPDQYKVIYMSLSDFNRNYTGMDNFLYEMYDRHLVSLGSEINGELSKLDWRLHGF